MDLVIVNPPRIFPRRPDYQSAKRLVDLILCFAALPFILPVILLCMLAIYFDSGRPIFFMQKRIGRGERPFLIYKFRTLYANHDESEGRSSMKAYVRGEIGLEKAGNGNFKPNFEQQIFRVGRILRRTSLDELPQLINVLKGEMSIVGPRPNVPWEVEEYRPWHFERLEVLPGITGLAQVNGRSGISFDTIVRYDIKYVVSQNLMLDLKIIWQTIRSVVLSKGAG
ncbi:MAG TPA: sugar transferase [Anaerolineales bacterium]|nr:sugar transferase [Anaerolineales bacterium]